MASLKHFPLDAIKIASTFVADLGRDRDSDAICSAIVELSHSLGLCAIGEGVETLEQFAALRALDCELAQGHLFGPARPVKTPSEAKSYSARTLQAARISAPTRSRRRNAICMGTPTRRCRRVHGVEGL